MENPNIERYELFYREVRIGTLEVDPVTKKHRYTPDPDGVASIGDRTRLLRVMKDGTDDFVEPIPFFENRLRLMKHLGEHEATYEDDFFVLREMLVLSEINP